MKKKTLLLILLILALPGILFAGEMKKVIPHIEFDQMMQLRFGLTYSFNEDWGLRSSLGFSPLGLTTFSYNLMGVYHFSAPERPWQFDLEFGLPLGYFNFLEGWIVDWDENIDDPFAGWLAGVSMRMSRRFSIGYFGLRLGGAAWGEHQRDSGWKEFRIMPIVALVYEF